jgi:hypothetical protein
MTRMQAMTIDCSVAAAGLYLYEEYFCAGYVGTHREFLDEWTSRANVPAVQLLDWSVEPDGASTTYVVDGGFLFITVDTLPTMPTSAVTMGWVGCDGELGTNPNIARWTTRQKAAANDCFEKMSAY